MPKRAVCELETSVNWWLKDSDQCRLRSGLTSLDSLDSDEIAQAK